MQSKRLRRLIASSGLFDARWYSQRYQDAPSDSKRALDDFIKFGLALGRDPGPNFSVSAYMRAHPEAVKDPRGAFVHFLERDVGEKQDPGPLPREELSAEYLSEGIRIGLDYATIENFGLSLRGWVLDPARPGLVHRIEVLGADGAIGTMLARTDEADRGAHRGPDEAAAFSGTFPVREHLVGRPVTLRVAGTEAEVVARPLVLAPAIEAPDPSAPSGLIAPEDRILGRVGTATVSYVAGWAFCERTRNADGLQLILLINDHPVAATRCVHSRSDAAEKYDATGPIGFQFHLPRNLWAGEPLRYEVVPATGRNAIQEHAGQMKPPVGVWVPAPPRSPAPPPSMSPEASAKTQISVIILNRNGHDALRDLLVSARRSGDLDRAEWIIVDHQSRDESETLCNAFAAAGHAIRFIARKGNFSFSASSNFGARQASGSVLVFADNDLAFLHPVLERVTARLEDDAIGILGARLLDHISAPAWQHRLPVQHDGVYLKPVSESPYLRVFEARTSPDLDDGDRGWASRPAATAAFVAMRRDDFEAIGGFDERYEDGPEGIDLCFRVMAELGKQVGIDPEIRIIHRQHHGREADTAMRGRRTRNNDLFNARWGGWLRRTVRNEPLSRRAFWFGRRPVIAFAVTSTDDGSDYLTALELGRAIQRIENAHVVYIAREDWGDFTGIDVLINMSPYFDLDRATATNPFITTVNWIRLWFDRWATRSSLHAFDLTVASSEVAARYLEEATGSRVPVMPTATDWKAMSAGTPTSAYECDYCFTGGHSGVRRDIEFDLDVPAIRGRGKIFGKGWDTTTLAAIAHGPLPYAEIPNVYASTKVVIDEGVGATAHWGSCSSRLLDALGAGCLVTTNNAVGARELFGDLLPVYQGRGELTRQLNYWLEHDAERQERSRQLQAIVREKHSYRDRAEQVLGLLSEPARRRISIKCPAPAKERNVWGDYHFAQSLARNLRRQGATVRIDLREDWDNAIADTDDVAIVLRGMLPYKPRTNQLSILWLISHPDDVDSAELDGYDHVYVASAPDAQRLAGRANASVSFLPQCTDTDHFTFDPELIGRRADRLLFVGNSRSIFRDSVRWSIEQDLDIHVFGDGWEPFIKDGRLKGINVPNEVLGELYGSSRMVLCDHWADMARMGYVSNRAFDVLAVGGRLVTDHVEGMESLLPEGSYDVFRNAEDLARIASADMAIPIEDRRRWADWVRDNHSFAVRASEILRLIDERS